MKRREFITLFGGAAAAWPLAARAQQSERMRRITVISNLPENDRSGQVDALRQGLSNLGWTEGRNIHIDVHWNVADPNRAQMVAKDVVGTQPDLIVCLGTPPTVAAAQLTKLIPIVFANVADPVAAGLVASYARPGGNVTGFSNFEPSIGGKWVEVLKDLDAGICRVTIVFNPETAATGGKMFLPSFEAAGAALGVKTIEAPVHDATGIEQVVDDLAREPNGALVAMPDTFTGANRDLIIRSALTHRLPLIAAYRTFADAGGLISYGPDPNAVARSAPSYVDRILKGEKPADLPIQAPTKIEMVINLKAAKALGLTISRDFLLRADEVIE